MLLRIQNAPSIFIRADDGGASGRYRCMPPFVERQAAYKMGADIFEGHTGIFTLYIRSRRSLPPNCFECLCKDY